MSKPLTRSTAPPPIVAEVRKYPFPPPTTPLAVPIAAIRTPRKRLLKRWRASSAAANELTAHQDLVKRLKYAEQRLQNVIECGANNRFNNSKIGLATSCSIPNGNDAGNVSTKCDTMNVDKTNEESVVDRTQAVSVRVSGVDADGAEPPSVSKLRTKCKDGEIRDNGSNASRPDEMRGCLQQVQETAVIRKS